MYFISTSVLVYTTRKNYYEYIIFYKFSINSCFCLKKFYMCVKLLQMLKAVQKDYKVIILTSFIIDLMCGDLCQL